MNKDDAKKFLPLVQALADGNMIQVKTSDCEWVTVHHIDVCYPSKYYRIKPEPRTFEMWLTPTGNMFPYDNFTGNTTGCKLITVQEVLA